MRRVFWVAVGAAGGIWAYRRAVAYSEQAREQGLVATAQQLGLSSAQVLGAARGLASATVTQVRAAQASQGLPTTGGPVNPTVANTRPGQGE